VTGLVMSGCFVGFVVVTFLQPRVVQAVDHAGTPVEIPGPRRGPPDGTPEREMG
jgi:hypothetical protein